MKFRNEKLGGIVPTDRRWSWLQVDLDAIRHNVNLTKSKIGPNKKLLVIVKADAYGHGAVQIAKTAINCGASYLGVATVDEAMELRDAKIKGKILVLSQPPVSAVPLLVKNDIIPAIHSTEFAIQYAEAADRAGKKAPYHLAVNTGMNRVGVRHNEVLDFLKSISFHRALELEGTFTHFATADIADEMEFKKQLALFQTLLDNMKSADIDPGIVHAANSAAIFRYPESHFDMVRLGVCMYGYYPSDLIKDFVELKPSMSVHARIVDERILGIGEGVSYGHAYRSRSSVKICTIPIYKGRIFPQVGAICMDMCMFEIDMNSAVAQQNFNAQLGDEVILVGADGDAEISIDDLAKACGTINYEIICSFSRRMPVVYV
ncbi:MAG: alanine racemase [Clostridia bacterium]|nr:alanine racemase [Clostridia bacterium]